MTVWHISQDFGNKIVVNAAQLIIGYREHNTMVGPLKNVPTFLLTRDTVVQKMEMFKITKRAATNMDNVIKGVRSKGRERKKKKRNNKKYIYYKS